MVTISNNKMSIKLWSNKRFLLSILVVGLISIFLIVLSVRVLYLNTVSNVEISLHNIIDRHEALLKTLSQQGKSKTEVLAFLQQLKLNNYPVNLNGEIVIGEKRDNQIHFLFLSNQKSPITTILPWGSDAGKPIQLALQKQNGFLNGIDYKGTKVFAEYSYIPQYNWGIVAKIPQSEVLQLVQDIYIISFVLLLIILAFSVYLLIKLIQPMLLKIEKDSVEIKVKIKEQKELEDFYKSIVNTGQSLIWIAGTDKKCFYFNQPWLQFTGRSIDQELGDGWTENVHPDDLADCIKTFVTSFDERKSFSMYYRMKRFSGDYRWIQDNGTPRYDDNGEFIGFIGHCLDVTDKKKNEEALHNAFMNYQLFFENTGSSNSIFDNNCCLINQNKESIKKLGIPKDEAVGKSVVELFGKEMGETIFTRMKRVLELGISETFESKFQLQTGIKWFRSSYQPIIDEYNNSIGVQIISQDTTETKTIETLQNLTTEIVKILNENTSIKEIVSEILKSIKRDTDISALGIRLKSGDDYPYIDTIGFSDEFLKTENSLTINNKQNGICRGKNGKPLLGCTCGLVISGGNDKPNAPLTTTGTFWINNTYSLLDLSSEQDTRISPRNNCMSAGFGSLAIIPIRTNDTIIGTLQLNEKRIDAFTPELINYFEGICLNIGNTLMRKQAEEALRKSENQLKDAIKIAKLAYWEFDIPKDEFTFNDHSYSMLHTNVYNEGGYELSSINYTNRFVHPDYRNTIANAIQKAKLSKELVYNTTLNNCLICADGAIKYTNVYLNIIKNQKGETVKVFGVSHDITELNAKEELIAETKNKFMQVFENAPVIISITDFETGKYIDVNEYALKISEYSREEVIGKKATEIGWISKDDKMLLSKSILEQGKIDALELSFVTKSGKVIYGLVNGLIITIDNKKCLLTITADITERKKNEKLIQKSNNDLLHEKYEKLALINSTDDLIWSFDKNFRLIAANEAYLYRVKISTGFRLDKGDDVLQNNVYPSDLNYYWHDLYTTVLKGNMIKQECFIPQNEKAPAVWLDVILNPIYFESEVIGVACFGRNITEQKETERKILNATIEAEESERNHFARELHEGLGPILSAIKLYFQWLNKTNLQTPKEELMKNIASTIEEAISTTKEISYKLSPHVLMNFGITLAVNSFIEKLKNNKLQIEFESTIEKRLENDIEITIYRVITECLNNTIKYANATKVSIQLIDKISSISLKYVDDGVGFDVDKVSKTMKGLGLFNMQNRIENFGGKFSILSHKNEGVFVEIEIPIKR